MLDSCSDWDLSWSSNFAEAGEEEDEEEDEAAVCACAEDTLAEAEEERVERPESRECKVELLPSLESSCCCCCCFLTCWKICFQGQWKKLALEAFGHWTEAGKYLLKLTSVTLM